MIIAVFSQSYLSYVGNVLDSEANLSLLCTFFDHMFIPPPSSVIAHSEPVPCSYQEAGQDTQMSVCI